MSLWELWLLTVIPSVGNIIGFIGILLGGTSAVLGFLGVMEYFDNRDSILYQEDALKGLLMFRKSIIGGAVAVFVLLVAALIPSKQDLYFIVGGSYVTNIEGIDKLPPNIIKATNVFLESLGNTAKPAKEATK